MQYRNTFAWSEWTSMEIRNPYFAVDLFMFIDLFAMHYSNKLSGSLQWCMDSIVS